MSLIPRFRITVFLCSAFVGIALQATTYQVVEGPRLGVARAYHTATPLADGTVLIAGGVNADGVIATAEVVNPAKNRVDATIPLGTARYRHTATLLPDGRVLIAGGINDANVALASAEIYDPVKKEMHSVSPLNEARAMHTASLLPDGSVLLVGGRDGAVLRKTCERFDPATEHFGVVASLPEGRFDHTATTLADGRIVIAGGTAYSFQKQLGVGDVAVLVYSPDSRTFISLPFAIRSKHVAVRLSDGTVYLKGGNNAGSNMIDVNAGKVTANPFDAGYAWGLTATTLKDGTAFFCGGYWPFSTSDAGYFDYCIHYGGDNQVIRNDFFARAGHTATLLSDGSSIFIAGGVTKTGPSDRTAVMGSK